MIYQNEKAIYVKIADRLCDDILSGKYKEEERVPSIRELAAEYEVNTNTVLRTFEILQRDEIIYQKRGITAGFYERSIYCFEGAGVKGDHNCMWDLNAFGLAPSPNVVKAWEEEIGSS